MKRELLWSRIAFGLVFWMIGSASGIRAEEESTSASQFSAPLNAPARKAISSRKKKSKGNRTREKETEGTEAPDRFEADTVIKSQYRQGDEQLEVDPD